MSGTRRTNTRVLSCPMERPHRRELRKCPGHQAGTRALSSNCILTKTTRVTLGANLSPVEPQWKHISCFTETLSTQQWCPDACSTDMHGVNMCTLGVQSLRAMVFVPQLCHWALCNNKPPMLSDVMDRVKKLIFEKWRVHLTYHKGGVYMFSIHLNTSFQCLYVPEGGD